MEIVIVFFILVLIFVYLYYKFTLKSSNVVPEGYIITYTRDACVFCDKLKEKIKSRGTKLKIITVNHGSLGNVNRGGEYGNLTPEVKTIVDSVIKRYEANAFPAIHKLDNVTIGLPDDKEYDEIFEPEINIESQSQQEPDPESEQEPDPESEQEPENN